MAVIIGLFSVEKPPRVVDDKRLITGDAVQLFF